MPRLPFILAIISLIAAPTSAMADDAVQLAQRDTAIEKVFSDLERRVIREVLGAAGVDEDDDNDGRQAKAPKGAPPGLAKRDRLPPGLERQLQRNGRLPPGLEKRQFPPELRARLPLPLQGTERVIVGNDAVLIDKATNVILDIIHDVVVNR